MFEGVLPGAGPLKEGEDSLFETQVFPRVKKWIEDLRKLARRAERKDCSQEKVQGHPEEYLTRVSYYYPILSLVGPRGSGKSTYLLTLVERLFREGRDVVLSPIDPHRFASRDSLLSWIMEELGEVIDRLEEKIRFAKLTCFLDKSSCAFKRNLEGDYWEEHPLKLCQERLADMIMEFMREMRGESRPYDEFELHLARMRFSRGYHLPRYFQSFIHCLTENWKKSFQCFKKEPEEISGPTFVIIPIDDADFAPEYLQDIIFTLRLLTPEVDRILFLVTFDARMAFYALKSYYRKLLFVGGKALSGREEPEEFLRELVQEFLVKFFPQETRVQLCIPGDRDKLSGFRPRKAKNEENLPDLQSLMAEIELEEIGPKEELEFIYWIPGTLKDWFIISDENREKVYATKYTRLLPESRRRLEQLWFVLREKDIAPPLKLINFLACILERPLAQAGIGLKRVGHLKSEEVELELTGWPERLKEGVKVKFAAHRRIPVLEFDLSGGKLILDRTLGEFKISLRSPGSEPIPLPSVLALFMWEEFQLAKGREPWRDFMPVWPEREALLPLAPLEFRFIKGGVERRVLLPLPNFKHLYPYLLLHEAWLREPPERVLEIYWAAGLLFFVLQKTKDKLDLFKDFVRKKKTLEDLFFEGSPSGIAEKLSERFLHYGLHLPEEAVLVWLETIPFFFFRLGAKSIHSYPTLETKSKIWQAQRICERYREFCRAFVRKVLTLKNLFGEASEKIEPYKKLLSREQKKCEITIVRRLEEQIDNLIERFLTPDPSVPFEWPEESVLLKTVREHIAYARGEWGIGW